MRVINIYKLHELDKIEFYTICDPLECFVHPLKEFRFQTHLVLSFEICRLNMSIKT